MSSFCPNSLMVFVALSATLSMAAWVCLPASSAASKTHSEAQTSRGIFKRSINKHYFKAEEDCSFSFLIELISKRVSLIILYICYLLNCVICLPSPCFRLLQTSGVLRPSYIILWPNLSLTIPNLIWKAESFYSLRESSSFKKYITKHQRQCNLHFTCAGSFFGGVYHLLHSILSCLHWKEITGI